MTGILRMEHSKSNVKHNLLSDLGIVTLNLHGFKGNWSYLQNLLDLYDIIFVQKIWLLDCELHFLSKFTVYARTGMATSVASGIVKGRPYGVGALTCFSNNCVDMKTWLTSIGDDDT